MSGTISRRNFLKQSSIAGITAATASVATPFAATNSSGKSRVVIVKDEKSYVSSKVVAENIQAMVDIGIKTLAGKADVGAAFEAIFPAAIKATDKIILKRNDISGTKSEFDVTNKAVTAAIKNGLTKMLGGTFPAANVTIHANGSSMVSVLSNQTYIINCPVCSCHGTDYGVTLSMKNTMNYLGTPSSDYHSKPKEWLHKVSLDARVKPKQVLSVMDAIVGNHKSGPGSAAAFTGFTLIMSKDIVAVDYHAIQLMSKQTGVSTARMTTGTSQLKAAETAGLGTCTPDKMETIELVAPYTTGVIQEYNPLVKSLKVNVMEKGTHFEFSLPNEMSVAELQVLDMKGALVWQQSASGHAPLVWNKCTRSGARVPDGMYAYRVKQAGRQVSGVVIVSM